MLEAAGVQIPENNLDDLHSSRKEDGTSKTMDPQDLLGSFLLADKDLIFLEGCGPLALVDGFTPIEDNIGHSVPAAKGSLFSPVIGMDDDGEQALCIVETDKVNHVVDTDIVILVVEIESFGMSFDEFNKETGSSDGLQPKQADLSCIHSLNEIHLHEIHVVLSKHEADQC
ncbi:hypothetical protein Tco_0964449 [Tanacetum coccineum]